RRRGGRAGADRGPAHHQHLLRRPRARHRLHHGLGHGPPARDRVAAPGARPQLPMRRLALVLLWLALSPALLRAQDSLWEKYMAAGAESFGKGQLPEAEKMWLAARKEAESSFGPNDIRLAATLTNLAELYRRQGKYPQAGWLHRRALAIRERALGPSHPGVTVSLAHLAALYTDLGRYAEAEPLYRRILTIRQNALGPDHPDVAAALDALAELHRRQGKFALAEPLYKQSLAIKEKALGADNPGLIPTLNQAALFY